MIFNLSLARIHPNMNHHIRLSKTQLYWLCQVLGWFSIVLIETINYTFILEGSFQWEYIYSFSRQAVYGIIVSHFYRVFFIKASTFDKPMSSIWIKGLMDTFSISILITAIILVPSIITSWGMITESIPNLLIEIFGRILNQCRYIVVWVIIYYMYKIQDRNRVTIQEKLETENLLATTELALLKTQLNPHFLFNALNSIKALVLIHPERSRDAIVKLSELLQFSLNSEKLPFISLEEEIYRVEKYLELEKIRFGNRLSYEFDIDDSLGKSSVPPALILTLAENAIKHGITTLPDGGHIEIQVKNLGGNIQISMINSGKLQGENIKGIGLKNVRGRLQNQFGGGVSLALESMENERVQVLVNLPVF